MEMSNLKSEIGTFLVWILMPVFSLACLGLLAWLLWAYTFWTIVGIIIAAVLFILLMRSNQ